MGLHNFVQELEYGDAKGLDTTSPTSLVSPGFVRVAKNVNIGVTGGYTKRDGFSESLTSAWTGLSIRQGFEFRKSDGITQILLYGTDNVTDGRFGKVVAGSVANVVSGISAIDRADMVQFEDRLFLFNGDSTSTPFVYDGSATRSLGLSAPTVDPTLTATTGGSLVEGNYIYTYTYVKIDATTGQVLAESSPPNLITVNVASPNNAVNIGVTASGDSNVTNIRVYRTVAGGSVAFLEATIADVTATHSSTAGDSSLSTTQLDLDNSKLNSYVGYDKAKFPIVARNRLFVVHSTRNEVRFSKIGQEAPLPESFPAVSYVNVEGKFGSADKVVGLGQIRGVPVVLKEKSIGRLEEIGLPEITRAEDPVTYIYREISDTVGAVNHFAQTQVFEELVFLGRDNIYATNGATVRPIANPIQATIKALDVRDLKNPKISAINDTKNRRIYFSVFEQSTDAEPNMVLVGDYQQYPNFRWTFYTEGIDSSTHPGIRAGSFFQLSNTSDGTFDVYFGNTDKNGQYYLMNDGEDDNTKGIFFKLVSRPYAMGQPLVTKLFKNTQVFAEAADNTYSLQLCAIYDLSTEEELCQNFTISGVGNNWNENNWVDDAGTEADPLIWAGSGLDELKYNPHRKAKFMQLVLNQTDKDAPVSILGWGVSGSIFSGI